MKINDLISVLQKYQDQYGNINLYEVHEYEQIDGSYETEIEDFKIDDIFKNDKLILRTEYHYYD